MYIKINFCKTLLDNSLLVKVSAKIDSSVLY